MVFLSTVFLFIFFPLVLIGYYNPFIKSRGFRNTFLFLASVFFMRGLSRRLCSLFYCQSL